MPDKIIPTAEQFFEQGGTYPELAIAFAKLHLEAALKAYKFNITSKLIGINETQYKIACELLDNAYPENLII